MSANSVPVEDVILFQHSRRKEDELDQMKTVAEKRLNEVREESLEVCDCFGNLHWHQVIFTKLNDLLRKTTTHSAFEGSVKLIFLIIQCNMSNHFRGAAKVVV